MFTIFSRLITFETANLVRLKPVGMRSRGPQISFETGPVKRYPPRAGESALVKFNDVISKVGFRRCSRRGKHERQTKRSVCVIVLKIRISVPGGRFSIYDVSGRRQRNKLRREPPEKGFCDAKLTDDRNKSLTVLHKIVHGFIAKASFRSAPPRVVSLRI